MIVTKPTYTIVCKKGKAFPYDKIDDLNSLPICGPYEEDKVYDKSKWQFTYEFWCDKTESWIEIGSDSDKRGTKYFNVRVAAKIITNGIKKHAISTESAPNIDFTFNFSTASL